MPLVSFNELMADAERGGYAVGYFESWDLESLLAVADAAQSTRSPVLLGFSGIYLHHPERRVQEPLGIYAALGNETCRLLGTPACLVFNESPYYDRVLEAIERGFGLVMYSDESIGLDEQSERIENVVEQAHAARVAVEGEMSPLPGVGGQLTNAPEQLELTDPLEAQAFVESTGVDALAVNVGQVHLHGRSEVRLDLDRLRDLRRAVSVPMVLHGASSVNRSDLQSAIRMGVRKINVGSVLKTTYLETLRTSLNKLEANYNPYELIGSGLRKDVLTQGRLAMQEVVMELMHLFGSAGKV